MLLQELFGSTESKSLISTTPKKPEKDKMCFPKKEAWHHTLDSDKGAGWSQTDKTSKEVEEAGKIKAVSKTKKDKIIRNRDTAPTGVNQKYKKYIKGVS